MTRKVGIRALIFLGYLFIGAGVFLGIEKSARDERNRDLEKKFEHHKAKLKADYGINETDVNSLTKLIDELIKAGHFKSYKQKNWDFVNAFFFSGNVVTTIGKYMYVLFIDPIVKGICLYGLFIANQ